MSGLNKVQIIGRLGQDPEMKYTQNGKAVCSLSVATSETYKDRDGNKQEKTEWHRLVAWDKTAELCGEYLKKGSLAYFEGKLQTRQYEKDGEKRYSTEIVVQNVRFLTPKNEQSTQKQKAKGDDFNFGPPPTSDDDVPF